MGDPQAFAIDRTVTLEEAERLIIIDRLDRLGGNKKATAASLGIARSALYAKLERLKIPHTRKVDQKLHADHPAVAFDARPHGGSESA